MSVRGVWQYAATLKAWLAPAEQIEFPWAAFEFVAASTAGLFLCSRSRCHPLLVGQHYGITFADDAMLVFQAHAGLKDGRIRRIDQAGHCRTVINGFTPLPHRLDTWEGRLYVAGPEVIRVFDLQTWEETDVLGPVPAPLGGGVCSLNGLLFRDGKTHVVCDTGRTSTVIIGDRAFEPERTIALAANHAHNIAFLGARMLVCDSDGHRLIDADGPVARFDGTPRGLAVTGDTIAVGVSDQSGGRLVFLDHAFAVTGTLAIPGDVQEVRAMFRPA